jgi:hypothetical protein
MIEHTASSSKRAHSGPANEASPAPAAAPPPRDRGHGSGNRRPWWLRSTLAVGRKAGVLALVAAALGLGYLVHRAVTPASVVTVAQQVDQRESKPKEQWWTCAMHPTVRLPRPGKCPL